MDEDRELVGPPAVYANNVQVYSNVFDIEIVFRRQYNARLGNGQHSEKFESLVSVAMSPQHAKSLVALLGHIVDNYEKSFGKLPEPKSMREDGFGTMQ